MVSSTVGRPDEISPPRSYIHQLARPLDKLTFSLSLLQTGEMALKINFNLDQHIFGCVDVDCVLFAAAVFVFILRNMHDWAESSRRKQYTHTQQHTATWSGSRLQNVFAFREIRLLIEHKLPTVSRFYATLVINRNNNNQTAERGTRLVLPLLVFWFTTTTTTTAYENKYTERGWINLCVCVGGSENRTKSRQMKLHTKVQTLSTTIHPQRNGPSNWISDAISYSIFMPTHIAASCAHSSFGERIVNWIEGKMHGRAPVRAAATAAGAFIYLCNYVAFRMHLVYES